MPRRKKGPFCNQTSFKKGYDPDRSKGAPETESEEASSSKPKTRLTSSKSDTAVLESHAEDECPFPQEPVRPRSHSMPPPACTSTLPQKPLAENWIVDEDKLLQSFNGAIREHEGHSKSIKGKNKGHAAVFEKLTDRRVGFGVVVQYKCTKCSFQSSRYELFQRMSDGSVQTNMQAGTAMAKSDVTPSKLEFFATTMNIKPPSRTTLQKNYNQALEVSEPLAELAMAENRRLVYEALERQGKVETGTIPDIEASTDGQYSLRSYHTPTGHSQSASIPVIEHETGEGLLIQHSALSKRDGSLKTHIHNVESEGAELNYKKTYNAGQYPLALQTVTVDGDASIRNKC